MEEVKTVMEEANAVNEEVVEKKYVKPVIAWSSIAVELILALVIGYLVCRI